MKNLVISEIKVLTLIKSLEASLEFNQSLNKGFKGKASEGGYGQGLVVGSITSLEMALMLVKSKLGVNDGDKSDKGKSKD